MGESATQKHEIVQYYRDSCTLVTSTWADGNKGPLIQVYLEGVVSQRLMKEINALYPGRHFVMSSESTTHFMNGESTIEMYHNCFKAAMKRKRTELSLPHTTPASVLADAFGGNYCAVNLSLIHI